MKEKKKKKEQKGKPIRINSSRLHSIFVYVIYLFIFPLLIISPFLFLCSLCTHAPQTFRIQPSFWARLQRYHQLVLRVRNSYPRVSGKLATFGKRIRCLETGHGLFTIVGQRTLLYGQRRVLGQTTRRHIAGRHRATFRQV